MTRSHSSTETGRRRLRGFIAVPAAAGIALVMAAALFAGTTPPTVLTDAAAVRALSQEQAARQLPVRLRGVVIGKAHPDGMAFVMQDKTEGIYLHGPPAQVIGLRRGDLIEVDGVTDPGGFSPMVVARRIVTLGSAPTPEPRRVTLDELNTAALDAQWVEVTGVVRRCEPMLASELGRSLRRTPPESDAWHEERAPVATGKTKLKLAAGAERLAVQVYAPLAPEAYVDADVRVRGICFNRHNANRQFLSPLLVVPEGVAVTVEKPPAPAPVESAPRSIASLLQFAREGNFGHLVHVRGVVTHQGPGESVWIHDGERGLRVDGRLDETLGVGEEVDVVGFPVLGGYSPVLEDVMFRRRGAGALPMPIRLTDTAMAVKHDAGLVAIEATLIDVRLVQDDWVLTLDWKTLPIKARLRATLEAPPPIAEWEAGSVVEAIGICAVAGPEGGPVSGVLEPRAFQLLLRSPADVRMVRAAPWWTAERIALLLSGIALVSLAAVAVVTFVARRRLREQAVQRAMAETEFSAILRERNRLAREIHDTLAQGLNATSVQLELAKNLLKTSPDSALQHVQLAHQSVRSSLAEARSSIWNMRSQALETGDLAHALERVLRLLAEGTGVETNLRVTGRARRLPPATENNLLRIGQEAIVNATRHARAQRIEVVLEFGEKQVRLGVTDDGEGFDPARPPRGAGGFGLVGMRERAAELLSDLTVCSAPGRGTEVALSVSAPA